jgi:histidine triad (HIT) family protein
MNSDCIFCKIVSGEIPADIVYRDDGAVVFRDLDPKAPVHLLVIPTRHVVSVAETAELPAEEVGHLMQVAARVAREAGVDGGYRVVTNVGADAGQSVFHLHIHVLGGRKLGWPPG